VGCCRVLHHKFTREGHPLPLARAEGLRGSSGRPCCSLPTSTPRSRPAHSYQWGLARVPARPPGGHQKPRTLGGQKAFLILELTSPSLSSMKMALLGSLLLIFSCPSSRPGIILHAVMAVVRASGPCLPSPPPAPTHCSCLQTHCSCP